MTSHAATDSKKGRPAVGVRRFGYTITIVVNGVVLYVANNIVAWGWFPWLSDDFDQVLPYIDLAILASVIVNVVYVLYDETWFRAIGETVGLGLSLVATAQLLRVFPFDFSGYAWNWDAIATTVLILMMVGMVAGIVGQMTTLVREIALGNDASHPAS